MDNPGQKNIVIHIHFYGFLADYTAARRIVLDVPNETSVAGLLKILSDLYPAAFRQEGANLEDDRSVVKVFRNNELITEETILQTLESSDEMRLFPAISGG